MRPLERATPERPGSDSTATGAETRPLSFAPVPAHSWKAELELWFEPGARTRLARRRHFGPLAVQRPFYPEKDGTCHVYLLHPPGGIAGGDELSVMLHLAPGARAVLTTPGAAKFYRSVAGRGVQSMAIDVAAGAVCEYLPQETIVFDGATAATALDVDLAADATFVGWDFICLGRPAAGERFSTGALTQRVAIRRAGVPVWIERLHLAGGDRLLDADFGLGGRPVFGTMLYAGPRREGVTAGLAAVVREAVGALGSRLSGPDVFAVSQLRDVVACRYLGPQAEEGKLVFTVAWDALRTALQDKPANSPRIWAT